MEALVSHAEKLIKDNLINRLPLLSMGSVYTDDDDTTFTVYIDILLDGVDVMLWISVTFIHGIMHKVTVTKSCDYSGNETYRESYIFGSHELAEKFLQSKVAPDIEKTEFYEVMSFAKDARQPLLNAIAHLRKYSPEHLVCQDDTKFITLLADHFKYQMGGEAYEEAKKRFESKAL
nr:hypothetical protein K-LCC10_0102 [Kaumoebavirus]